MNIPGIARGLGVGAALGLLALGAAAFDLQGHRGTRGNMPENTLAGFQRALEIGVTTLELDIGFTADGVAVISHDQALNPDITRDAAGQWLSGPGPLISSLTFAQLQTYDVGRIKPGTRYAQEFSVQQGRDGERIPSLASLFALVKSLGASHVKFDMETKIDPRRPRNTLDPAPFVEAMLAVVREHGMEDRVMVQSFDWRSLQVLQKTAPKVATMYLTSQRNPRTDTLMSTEWTAGFNFRQYGSAPKMVKAAGGSIWAPQFNDLNPALLKEAQDLGLQVIPWTVNETADMTRLIAMGVDGIISDYPDRVRLAMQARGGAVLPPPVKKAE